MDKVKENEQTSERVLECVTIGERERGREKRDNLYPKCLMNGLFMNDMISVRQQQQQRFRLNDG